MSASAVTVYAPGSVGNVGPGVDILGLALAGAGDSVTAAWREDAGVEIVHPGDAELPREAHKHSSGIAAIAVLKRAGVPKNRGVGLWVRKGLPLSGGQGGSAASGVAGAVAVNALLGHPLDERALLEICLEVEATVAGRHADNLAPSLLGGITLVRSLDPIDVVKLPVPAALRVVLVHPEQRLRTRDARAALPESVPRALALSQAAQVAAMVAALASGDLALLGRALDDRIAEPARAPLLPGFLDAKRAALDAGALGASISGSGPTAFALVDDATKGAAVGAAMVAAYRARDIACTMRVADVDRAGARVIAGTDLGGS